MKPSTSLKTLLFTSAMFVATAGLAQADHHKGDGSMKDKAEKHMMKDGEHMEGHAEFKAQKAAMEDMTEAEKDAYWASLSAEEKANYEKHKAMWKEHHGDKDMDMDVDMDADTDMDMDTDDDWDEDMDVDVDMDMDSDMDSDMDDDMEAMDDDMDAMEVEMETMETEMEAMESMESMEVMETEMETMDSEAVVADVEMETRKEVSGVVTGTSAMPDFSEYEKHKAAMDAMTDSEAAAYYKALSAEEQATFAAQKREWTAWSMANEMPTSSEPITIGASTGEPEMTTSDETEMMSDDAEMTMDADMEMQSDMLAEDVTFEQAMDACLETGAADLQACIDEKTGQR